MNTALSGNGRVDDIKGHAQGELRGATKVVKPEMRDVLARQSFEQKIRKVGELIRLRQKIKTDVSNSEHERANGARSGGQSTGLPGGRALREVNARQWAKNLKK